MVLYMLTDVLDPRVADWLFMQSPWPTLQLTGIYLLAIYLGPKLMRNRKPFENKIVLAIYNLALVLLNLHIFIEVRSYLLLVIWSTSYVYH